MEAESPEPAALVQLMGWRRHGRKPLHPLAALSLPVRTCSEQPCMPLIKKMNDERNATNR